MKFIPKSVTRAGARSALKVRAKSPTLLVVGGVIGFGVTTVLAVKATRQAEPIIEQHKKERFQLSGVTYLTKQDKQKDLVRLYGGTAISLTKVYGPTIVVGALSTAAVLSGHNILQRRHVATMAAYSGLMDQFRDYRGRVAKTLGEETEKEIYDGAHGEWVEDPEHPGEKKRVMVYDPNQDTAYLRPWLEEDLVGWTKDPVENYLFLQGLQKEMNFRLQTYGYVLLSDVYRKLGLPLEPNAIVTGWLYDGDGDNYVDFGFLSSDDPQTVGFREGRLNAVRLKFNVDGPIWDKI